MYPDRPCLQNGADPEGLVEGKPWILLGEILGALRQRSGHRGALNYSRPMDMDMELHSDLCLRQTKKLYFS